MYGKELILDLHNCDPLTFNRIGINDFLTNLCNTIDMEKCDLHWWDDVGLPEERKETEPHLKGTSVVQFIKTSTIVIHTLDLLKKVFFNCFSCKEFDSAVVVKMAENYFKGNVINLHEIIRE